MNMMKRPERFYNTKGVRDEHGFDLVKQFKWDVTKGASMEDPADVGGFYSELVVRYFGLKGLEDDLAEFFRNAYRNYWQYGMRREKYPVEYFKNNMGPRYSYAKKVFKKNTSLKEKLEAAGFPRVGFVTFINMICYIIWTQCYVPG